MKPGWRIDLCQEKTTFTFGVVLDKETDSELSLTLVNKIRFFDIFDNFLGNTARIVMENVRKKKKAYLQLFFTMY